MPRPKRQGALHKGGGAMETTMVNKKALLPPPFPSKHDFGLFLQSIHTFKCLSP